VLVGALALLAPACRQDMHDAPKYEPLEASAFFPDGRASRHPVEGTVARGQLARDPALLTGIGADGNPVSRIPLTVDRALLERGRERFDIFCSPCHGRLGDGQGMIVRRGYKQPQSFHVERLRTSPVGYFFDVQTNGFGQMPSYASLVSPEDRWAIAAYVRVLQFSQHARLAALTEADRAELARLGEEAGAPAAGETGEGGH
jgi:mono/diheme cytochrome c family protein